jgi:hypothetical protein
MRIIPPILLALLLGVPAAAADPAASLKTDFHVLQHPASDREGGETIAEAVSIAALPFADTGATCDNIDDYDSPCPYFGSTSPDVVYSYTPPADQAISIDLCGSQYDTKVFVFDQNLEIVACNDDYYTGPPCGVYVSFIEVLPVIGGQTYYIVIDGYGGDCGNYELMIGESLPCCLECPPDGVLENEPQLQDGYVDSYNGGCDSSPPVFQTLLPDDEGCVDVCGISGWYVTDGQNQRDTDWFEAVGTGQEVYITLTGEYPVQLQVLLPDCPDPVVVDEGVGMSYLPVDLVYPSVAGQVFWIRAGPLDDYGWVNEFDYVLTVCGLDGPVATKSITWDRIKSLYR